MKFSNKKFSISSEYARQLIDRRETFRVATKTRKALNITMVTSCGLEHNAGWQYIQNEVELDDLFEQL